MIVELRKSNRRDKRYMATFDGKKTIHFGAKDGETFIDHKNNIKKSAWIARHKVREDWNNISTPGALSKHLLWNRETLRASIRNTEKRFNLNIKYRYG